MPEDHMGDEKDWGVFTGDLERSDSGNGQKLCYQRRRWRILWSKARLPSGGLSLADATVAQCGTIQLDMQLPERI